MMRPIVFLVDGSADGAALEAELRGRYGAAYEILAAGSPAIAVGELEVLREAGREVALVLAGDDSEDIAGVELLSRASALHPSARRLLLVGRPYWSAPGPVLEAIALGRIDQFLTRPWRPVETMLHPVITELLAEWTRARTPECCELVRVIGERWDPASHEIRDLLERNGLTYGFYEAGSEGGRQLMADVGLTADRLPVVVTDHAVLVRPARRELAEAVNARTEPGSKSYDVAIVGAGPAGLAAAVYGAAEGLRTVAIESTAIGGQASSTSLIRNYLGFPRGISGAELASRAFRQGWQLGAEHLFMRSVVGLRVESDLRVLRFEDGAELSARSVILATGVAYSRLGVASLEALVGRGVFYGAGLAEARALAGQSVFVVGGGNSAGQAAVHLAKYCARVTLLVRGGWPGPSMSAYLRDQIERASNIVVRHATEVVDARGTDRMNSIILRDQRSGALQEEPAAAVFVLIGASPRTDWLADTLERDSHGYLLTGTDQEHSWSLAAWPLRREPLPYETSMPGVFAAGDVRHRSLKRVAAAAAEGAAALVHVRQFLEESAEPRVTVAAA